MADPALSFDYEADERWRRYINSLEFASTGPSSEALFKLKRRWYKASIDPAYDASVYNSAPNNNTASSAASDSASRHSTQSAGQSQQQPGFEPRPNPTAQHPAQQPHATVGDHARHNPAAYVRFLSTLFLLLNAILYVAFMLFNGEFSYDCYRRAFKGALLAYAVSLYEAHWPIQFSREALARVVMDSNCQYLVYSILFLGQPPMLMAVTPVFVYGVYSATDFGRTVAQVARLEPAQRMLTQAQAFLAPRTAVVMDAVASMEIALFPFMLMHLVLGQMGLSSLVLYFMFLRTRYFTSPNMQTQFRQLRLKADALAATHAPAAVRPLYARVVSFLSSLGEMQ